MTAPVSVAGLRSDAAFLSLEHQLHLADVLGKHAWQVDIAAPSFTFTGDHPLTCNAVHFLGTAAAVLLAEARSHSASAVAALSPRSWLWSWANPSGIAPARAPALPIIVINIIVMGLLIAVPSLSLWLPSYMTAK